MLGALKNFSTTTEDNGYDSKLLEHPDSGDLSNCDTNNEGILSRPEYMARLGHFCKCLPGNLKVRNVGYSRVN